MELNDFREGPARYYDLGPHHPLDVPFYIERIRSPATRILELGCGTGRVSLPLLPHCSFLHGIDHSEAMLEICRAKVDAAGVNNDSIELSLADISGFDLGSHFDLIIAPFRVMQNLESDAQLDGLLQCIARHLSVGGRCILNVFRPSRDREGMISSWASPDEHLAWEVETAEGRVACFDRRIRVQADPLVVYPELIYRKFIGDKIVDEAVLSIAMRCFYPDELLERIESVGFSVTKTWGGYSGEDYGVGNELVVEFMMDTQHQL